MILFITKVCILLKYNIGNELVINQQSITQPLTSPERAVSEPLVSTQRRINVPSMTPQQEHHKTTTKEYFVIVDLTVVYLCWDAYVLIMVCLSYGIIIIIFNLTRMALQMTLPTVKQLQYWCFGICNVIEVWSLLDCRWTDITTVYYHNSYVFHTIGYIYITWIKVDAMHRNLTQELHGSTSGSYKLKSNIIIQYILNKTVVIVIMITPYCTITLNVDQIVNKIHNSNLIITMIDLIDIITYQMGILVAICAFTGETSSFMVIHLATKYMQIKFGLYSDETDSLMFYLIANNIHHLQIIMPVLNSIATILARIDHDYIILIMIVVINVISIHKLDSNRNNGRKLREFKKTRIIWFFFNRNKNIATIVVQYKKFNANILIMDKLYSTTNTAKNSHTTRIIINMIDIIEHKTDIDYIYHFTMDGFNDISNSSSTAVYFMMIDYNVFEFDLVVSKINTTNATKIFKILQFIIIIIATVRMSMKIIIILKFLSLQLFCDIVHGMVYVVDILIKISTLGSFSDALTVIFDAINSNLDKTSEFECNYNGYGYKTIVVTNMYKIGGIRFFLSCIYFMKRHTFNHCFHFLNFFYF